MEPYLSTAQYSYSAIPVQPWYEKQEMVKAAQAHGYKATEARLDNWIKKGLVGRAERAGLGRGQGSVAWWSAAQFTLFLEILRAREQGKLRIGQLYALPVWRWVYWGERGGVSLPQVQRAMATWVASVKKTTTERERKEARKGVEKLQGPGASGKLALISELAAIGAFQKEPDPDLLRYLLESIVTDSPLRATFDNGETRSADVETLATMFPVRLRAFQQYEEQIACLPDVLWEWARTFLLFLQFQGQKTQPLLAKNPRLADRYRRLTVYDVLLSSCYDLLAPLSLVALLEQLSDKFIRDPWPFLNYREWQSGKATSHIKTTLVPSPVLLPDGENLLYLRNEVGIAYQEKMYCFTIDLPFL